MVSYAQAEAILARVYGADAAAQAGAFRARIKHFRKLGIPLDRPTGQGKRLPFSQDEIYQWAFCFELSEFGIDPTIVAQFLRAYWAIGISQFFEASDQSSDDLFYKISPRLMSKTWEPAEGAFSKQFPSFADHGPAALPEDAAQFAFALRGRARRACLINVSDVVRLLRYETERVLGGSYGDRP